MVSPPRPAVYTSCYHVVDLVLAAWSKWVSSPRHRGDAATYDSASVNRKPYEDSYSKVVTCAISKPVRWNSHDEAEDPVGLVITRWHERVCASV